MAIIEKEFLENEDKSPEDIDKIEKLRIYH